MAVLRPNISFLTKQVVVSDAEMKPCVGFENLDESPGGWKYDIKRWASLFDLRLPTLPKLSDASTQGLKESEYFKSGVGDLLYGDLNIDKFSERFVIDRIINKDINGNEVVESYNERQWVPIIRHGQYYRYKTQFFLYSDHSRIQYISVSENRDNRNYLKLDVEPHISSPILATTLKRNPKTNTPEYFLKIKQCADFTGIYSDGEEKETVTNNCKILWDNVDYNKKEFIVDNTIDGETSLYFNRDYTMQHGVVPEVYQDLAACEILGSSSGSSYQVYKLRHFPIIADNTFHLYVVDSNTWQEWERVDSWFDLITEQTYTANKYFVDKDLGIVYFGSGQNGGVPLLGTSIVVTYNSTLRIEYEEEEQSTEVTALEADVNPVTQHINQGFVAITHDQLEAASIILSIDKRRIPFTANPPEYGPVTTGSDYALLRATVKSTEGNIIPNKLVGFNMSPANVGTLDGSSESSSITDGLGQAYSSYQPPVSGDTLGIYTTTVRASTHPSYLTGYKEVIVKDTNAGYLNKESELYIYQILKDDLLLGYDSIDEWIDYKIYTGDLDIPPWANTTELEEEWRTDFKLKHDLKEWGGSEEFNSSNKLSGRKVVVYKIEPAGSVEHDGDNWDEEAINPITGELGAVVPVRPELVEKINDDSDPYNNFYRLIYPEDAILDPDPDDSNNPIGGYWIVGPRVIKFRASTFSEYYNRVIYSNELYVRISLPTYMLGEYLTPLLKKIPYGWKFPTDTDSVAAALDGATFITINPYSTYNTSSPYNNILWGPNEIFDLINGTISNNWASAPFNSIGFQFVKHGASVGFQFEK